MSDGLSIKTQVDSSLLDKVERECYQILYQQRLRYNERWYSSALFAKGNTVLRLAGFIVSMIGVLLSVFYLVYPSSCPKYFFAEIYLLIFIGAGVLFYYIPRLQVRVISRLRKAGAKGCQRMARRYIARARKVVPYQGEYTIKGDLITYFRGRKVNGNEKWQQVWSRRMQGYAIVANHVSLIFRKPTSLQPSMLILYEGNEPMESVFKGLGISYQTLTL